MLSGQGIQNLLTLTSGGEKFENIAEALKNIDSSTWANL